MRIFEGMCVKQHNSSRFAARCGILVAAMVLTAGPVLASGSDDDNDDDGHHGGKRGVCSQTAKLAAQACMAEARDDYLIAKAVCINMTDRHDRRICEKTARIEAAETRELCKDQFDARLDVCDLVGEGPYDPDFDPDNFSGVNLGNAYFPLEVGNEWRYESTFDDEGEEVTETITVKVVDNGGIHATKNIEGVTCVVVNDVVEVDGELIEDTDDWYALHAVTNDIWYCGEIARNYEAFDGDDPDDPELVDIEGSWKAGRDGAQPGILVKDMPVQGEGYRQEVLIGDAEDVAEVLATDYVFGEVTEDPESLDYLVPGELAGKFCSDAFPCLVTRDLTALEPDVYERKYYAQGVGVFLEVDLTDEVTVELVECNFDDKCID